MATNNRIFYAVHKVGFKHDGVNGTFQDAHGVQSVGITTNFNLEQVFELGQICIYENIENIPDIEVTSEKVLDGYPLLYHMGTQGSNSATIAGRSVDKTMMALAIYPDDQDTSTGTAEGVVEMSGMFVSAVSYTMPVEGNATESVTLVGNNKVWNGVGQTAWKWDGFSGAGAFTNCTDEPVSLVGDSGGVQRREDVIFEIPDLTLYPPTLPNGDPTFPSPAAYPWNENAGFLTEIDGEGGTTNHDTTILPGDINGIESSGVNRFINGQYGAHVQNISCSVDFGREELFELGRRGPYFRFVNFPVEVSTEIEIIGVSGDDVDATEQGALGNGNNLRNRRIRIRMREGTRIDLGDKNKLATVSYSGGDAGGDNVSISYSYTNFNDFTVTHPADPTDSVGGGPWVASPTDLRALPGTLGLA
jgi:hypothetical protein